MSHKEHDKDNPSHQRQSAESVLKQSGYKLTKARSSVLQILLPATKPMSTSEIHEKVSQNSKIDRVSTYRVLELLQNLNLIHKVPESGFIFCSHSNEKETGHAFLICSGCQKVQEISLTQKLRSHFLKTILHKNHFGNFKMLQITGICSKCETGAAV